MSISAVGAGVGYTPLVQTPVNTQPTAASTVKGSDSDHDGDTDTPGRLDVKG